jgi:hypothetical protein
MTARRAECAVARSPGKEHSVENQSLVEIGNELDLLRAEGLYNNIRTIESPMDGHVQIDGRELLNFCANNYLGWPTIHVFARRQSGELTSSGWVPARCGR